MFYKKRRNSNSDEFSDLTISKSKLGSLPMSRSLSALSSVSSFSHNNPSESFSISSLHSFQSQPDSPDKYSYEENLNLKPINHESDSFCSQDLNYEIDQTAPFNNEFNKNDSCKVNRFFPDEVVEVLNQWFYKNQDYPYPDENMTNILAKEAKITAKQVSKWFANKRVRSNKCFKQSLRIKREVKNQNRRKIKALINEADKSNLNENKMLSNSHSGNENSDKPKEYIGNETHSLSNFYLAPSYQDQKQKLNQYWTENINIQSEQVLPIRNTDQTYEDDITNLAMIDEPKLLSCNSTGFIHDAYNNLESCQIQDVSSYNCSLASNYEALYNTCILFGYLRNSIFPLQSGISNNISFDLNQKNLIESFSISQNNVKSYNGENFKSKLRNVKDKALLPSPSKKDSVTLGHALNVTETLTQKSSKKCKSLLANNNGENCLKSHKKSLKPKLDRVLNTICNKSIINEKNNFSKLKCQVSNSSNNLSLSNFGFSDQASYFNQNLFTILDYLRIDRSHNNSLKISNPRKINFANISDLIN